MSPSPPSPALCAGPVHIVAVTALLALATLLPGAVRFLMPAAPDAVAGQAPEVAALPASPVAGPDESGAAVLDAPPEAREDG